MISDDFAFYGFDETSWDRLVSLFLGEDRQRGLGVLVLVVGTKRDLVAAYHTVLGSLDLETLPPADDLETLCEITGSSACIVMRERAMVELGSFLEEPLDASQDFAARVFRFARSLRELGNGNWLKVWPNPLPDLLLAAAPAAGPAVDFLIPDGTSVALGVFDEGELYTGAALRRNDGRFDALAGPGAIMDWAGPLGGDWRRDHRVLTKAIERELGPLHIGSFMELGTARSLLRGGQTGEWALAYATRNLMVHPFPTAAAAGLGIDVVGGAAQYALQVLDQLEPDELLHVAKGFWRGLTDGKGIEGLLGFSPFQGLSSASNPEPDESSDHAGEMPTPAGTDDSTPHD